jgi:hypothetical protein
MMTIPLDSKPNGRCFARGVAPFPTDGGPAIRGWCIHQAGRCTHPAGRCISTGGAVHFNRRGGALHPARQCIQPLRMGDPCFPRELETINPVGNRCTRTPSRDSRNAANDSVSAALKAPLIVRLRSAVSSIVKGMSL